MGGFVLLRTKGRVIVVPAQVGVGAGTGNIITTLNTSSMQHIKLVRPVLSSHLLAVIPSTRFILRK